MALMKAERTATSTESLRAISYSETKAAQPPISITVATPTPLQHLQHLKPLTGRQKPTILPDHLWLPRPARSKLYDDDRRDSGLAPSNSTAPGSRTTSITDVESSRSPQESPSLNHESTTEDSTESTLAGTGISNHDDPNIPPVPQMPFLGIVTEIPTGSFDDLTLPGQVEFSSRGSMLIGGKKAGNTNGSLHTKLVKKRNQAVHLPAPMLKVPKRIMSPDEEMLSNKVRAMYNDSTDHEPIAIASPPGALDEDPESNLRTSSILASPSIDDTPRDVANGGVGLTTESRKLPSADRHLQPLKREERELAGGIEDWENVDNGDVDRYGFIIPSQASQDSSLDSLHAKPRDPLRIQRVSTVLQLASEAPRRRRSRLGRSPSSAKSPARSATATTSKWLESRVNRPASSQSSYRGTLNSTHAKLRSATSKLPRHRDRRILDEAGDMLTLPPGLADYSETHEDSRAVEESRRRERRREEKWQKMAKIVNNHDCRGGGMIFDFDTKSPKVIERTWKGIPDRWRATAWHSFLSASARRRNDLPSDETLKAKFHQFVEEGSPDDMQIDIDVPRTINSHIMFRRRYRGGQRLLFRVLHCMSIYFPDTGYVQGMAALAATLLCYFDEEMAFVMLVRLWQLRGLERLYQSGFEGLMQALEEFEKGWLANGEVSTKLVSNNPWQMIEVKYSS